MSASESLSVEKLEHAKVGACSWDDQSCTQILEAVVMASKTAEPSIVGIQML